MAKLIMAGCAVADILMQPLNREVFDRDEVKLQECFLSLGGDMLNASINLSKLGIGKEIMPIAVVGDDVFGKFVLDGISKAGLCTDFIKTKQDVETSKAFVMIESIGERHFATHGQAIHKLLPEDVIDAIGEDTEAVHIGSLMSCAGLECENHAKLFKYCRERNIRTSFDVTGGEGCDMARIHEGLYYTDIFFVSYEEAIALSGGITDPVEIAAFFKQFNLKELVLKLGHRGCYVTDYGENTIIMDTYEDIPRVDTTGAGDSFVSAYLYGKFRGFSMEECCVLGNVNGSLCIQKIGATASTGTLEDIKAFIRKHGAKTLDAEAFLAKL